jgi:hypothetical protein
MSTGKDARALYGLHAPPWPASSHRSQGIEEPGVIQPPLRRLLKIGRLLTIAPPVVGREHPTDAKPKPGLGETAEEAVLAIVAHVTSVLVLQKPALLQPNGLRLSCRAAAGNRNTSGRWAARAASNAC